jgi:hypothetical protein
MKHALLGFFSVMSGVWAATPPAELKLPTCPVPIFVEEGGRPKEISSTRLLRELFRGGVRNADQFETVDQDYALLRSDNVVRFAAWLEVSCQGFGVDLLQLRTRAYDGGTFSRLLEVSASLALLQIKGHRALAVPIGLMTVKRDAPWGDLKRDGVLDAYIIFATEAGILVYDPPTRQLVNLADFPNKAGILRLRF